MKPSWHTRCRWVGASTASVQSDGAAVRFTLPFDSFESKPIPADLPAYLAYREAMMAFIEGRSNRMLAQVKGN